jgi:predicted metalloendopeptidase
VSCGTAGMSLCVRRTQGGLGLPDESFHRRADFAAIREAYLAHITRMLQLLGRAAGDAEAEASCVVRVETRLAAGHWTTSRLVTSLRPTTFGVSRSCQGSHRTWIGPLGRWSGCTRTGLH